MERNDVERRTVLRGVAGVLGAGVLAGCTGGSGSDSAGSGDNGSGDTSSGGGTETGAGPTDAGASNTETGGATDAGTTGTGTENASATGGGTGGASATVDQYLAEAKGYDGSIADETGSDTVEIAVGAGESGFAFDPAAVRVSPGTTVRWAWTGKGSAHNVVSKGSGPLDSGQPKAGSDITYEKTLDQPGTYRYYCEPHRRLGMKGAVVVTE